MNFVESILQSSQAVGVSMKFSQPVRTYFQSRSKDSRIISDMKILWKTVETLRLSFKLDMFNNDLYEDRDSFYRLGPTEYTYYLRTEAESSFRKAVLNNK
jgi:hypothetical protein